MSRTTARKHAFALIFQIPFHNEINSANNFEEFEENYLAGQPEVAPADRLFIKEEFRGAAQQKEIIDQKISPFLEGWTLDRLSKVDLAVLRLAVYEMIYLDDIPVSVSINEAVELSREYGTDESPGFVNGVLGKIAHA